MPAEIVEGSVINTDQYDVTDNFRRGAEETLLIARLTGTTIAVLKQRSPSCGYGQIYDGSFSGRVIAGNGITADVLSENGVRIYTEEDVRELMEGECGYGATKA